MATSSIPNPTTIRARDGNGNEIRIRPQADGGVLLSADVPLVVEQQLTDAPPAMNPVVNLQARRAVVRPRSAS